MSYQLQIRDTEYPEFLRQVEVSPRKYNKIQDGDSAQCIEFTKMVTGVYKPHEHDSNYYYRIMDGHKFVIRKNDPDVALKEIMANFMLIGEYEPVTTKLVHDVLEPGDVVVDIGASIGYFTLLFSSIVGKDGKVIAIEPTSNQYPRLMLNIQNNGYEKITEVHNIAGWDKNEKVKIQVNAGANADINGRILDEVLPEKVDFIKIDVDGSEPKVLRGIEETVKRNKNLKMVIEYYPKYIKNLGNDPKEVIAFLDKYFTYGKIDGDYGDGYWNYFCVRK